jgi:uncharacterized damage-inducible protein DinB
MAARPPSPAPSVETRLIAPPGFRSATVARFLWQMDEQRRSLLKDVSGASVAELQWQLAPGMNSIGMLLAHIGYAENHLVQVGLEGKPTSDTRTVIGIGEEDEGMPLPAGAPPAPALAGKALESFVDLLARARAHTARVAATLSDHDLDRDVIRPRPDGSRRIFNLGWVFYHLLEHEAGHRGQINLLRHAYRQRLGTLS